MPPLYLATLVVVAMIVIGGIVVAWIRKQDHVQREVRELMPRPGQAATEEDVVRLIRAGHKIQAIKVYRELHGTGLADSKLAVEALEAGNPPPSTGDPVEAPDPAATGEEVLRLAREGQKIEAIKLYREIHRAGLAEAKAAVEDLMDRHGH